jgi:hypothetical protein
VSFWSAERIAELHTRWDNGESAAEISRAMNAISRNAVIGMVHRLKLAARAAKNFTAARRTNGRRLRKSNGPAGRNRFTGRATGRAVFYVPAAPDMPANFKGIFELCASDCRWPVSGSGAETLFLCGTDSRRLLLSYACTASLPRTAGGKIT